MNLAQNQRHNLGFSLPEVIAIVVILGILAALAAPSFFSWVNSRNLGDVMSQMEGALKEAQAEAIRKSQQCTLTITTSSVTATPPNCLPTGTRDLTQVSGSNVNLVAQQNTSPIEIQFSSKGSTTSSNIFVLFNPDQSQGMRCLAISSGIGIIRTGEFQGPHPPQSIQATPENCYIPM